MSELDFVSQPHKPKKIHYDQKYSKLWEVDPEFAGWIQPSNKGKYHFYCKACKRDLTCGGGKYNISKHASSVKHINNLKGDNMNYSDSGASDQKELLELLNDDPLDEYSTLPKNEECGTYIKVKKRKLFPIPQNTNETTYANKQSNFKYKPIEENKDSNKEDNFKKWTIKKREMLEIELLEMRNYKMKLELWEKEQELQLSTSKYTKNILRK